MVYFYSHKQIDDLKTFWGIVIAAEVIKVQAGRSKYLEEQLSNSKYYNSKLWVPTEVFREERVTWKETVYILSLI